MSVTAEKDKMRVMLWRMLGGAVFGAAAGAFRVTATAAEHGAREAEAEGAENGDERT